MQAWLFRTNFLDRMKYNQSVDDSSDLNKWISRDLSIFEEKTKQRSEFEYKSFEYGNPNNQ